MSASTVESEGYSGQRSLPSSLSNSASLDTAVIHNEHATIKIRMQKTYVCEQDEVLDHSRALLGVFLGKDGFSHPVCNL